MKRNSVTSAMHLCYRSGSFSKVPSWQRLVLIVVVGLVLLFTYSFLQDDSRPEFVLSPSRASKEAEADKLLVDTPTCKIATMNPWHESVENFLTPSGGYPKDCARTHRAWTYVDGVELVLNESAVHESGFSLGSIRCCYRTIERVEQPLSDYDTNADNYVKYSDRCYPLKNGRQSVDSEFIRVRCISTSVPLFQDVVYRDFFAIPQTQSDRLVARKLFQWKAAAAGKAMSTRGESADNEQPPNIVIVGIDNNSRMNSYRTLNGTLRLLRKMGAVEMLGYTKVAENTFPNTAAFISGYSDEELQPICYSSNADPQDDCPFLWKAFDKLGYLTVHAEDSPYVGGFNYLKTGFLRKPTDFYLRILMLAISTHMPRADYYHTDCIGRHMTEEVVFNYITDILRLASSSNAPVFVHSWLTSIAHLNYNNLQFGDESIQKFLHFLESTSNTVFFFMSDHGQRYGPIRETTQGWYEDKLPTQWVYLPPKLRERFPDWDSSLRENSKRLTSHFDVYKTMLHILGEFDKHRLAEDFYNASKAQKGQSLFAPVSQQRSCDDAGIPVNFCACSKPEDVDVEREEVKRAAQVAVDHLKTLVPLDVCAEPVLKKITGAKFIHFPNRPVYLVSVLTDPGDFLFEVNVEKEGSSGEFVITTDLLRMNKISRPANCVQTPLLERYCYCK